jgi:hypothetical protein
VNHIKRDLIELEWYSMDWIDLTEDRDWWKALTSALFLPMQQYTYIPNKRTSRLRGYTKFQRMNLKNTFFQSCFVADYIIVFIKQLF